MERNRNNSSKTINKDKIYSKLNLKKKRNDKKKFDLLF